MLDNEDMYNAIVNGQVSLEEFETWVFDMQARAVDNAEYAAYAHMAL